MFTRKMKIGALLVLVGALGLTGCQKQDNPLLKDIGASSKILNSGWNQNMDAFNAISATVAWNTCFTSTENIEKVYGNKAAAYKIVCQKFVTSLLTSAHKNPLFRSATKSDFGSPEFYRAYTKESTREFLK